jgi:hypothetical protein
MNKLLVDAMARGGLNIQNPFCDLKFALPKKECNTLKDSTWQQPKKTKFNTATK